MIAAQPPRSGPSRAESLSDAAVHLAGLAAAVVAVPLLVARAVDGRGDASAILGTSVYGATLIAMILCSALYNMVPSGAWTQLLRRLDHSAIYFKIAGTYTAFTLLSDGHGMVLLAGLWAAALIGTALRVLAHDRTRNVAIGLYVAMGWAGVFAGWSLFAQMSPEVLALIVVGGLLYTGGMTFYLLERLPFHTTIWHLFVLAASVAFFAAVDAHLADTAAVAAALAAEAAAPASGAPARG